MTPEKLSGIQVRFRAAAEVMRVSDWNDPSNQTTDIAALIDEVHRLRKYEAAADQLHAEVSRLRNLYSVSEVHHA